MESSTTQMDATTAWALSVKGKPGEIDMRLETEAENWLSRQPFEAWPETLRPQFEQAKDAAGLLAETFDADTPLVIELAGHTRRDDMGATSIAVTVSEYAGERTNGSPTD